MIHTAAGKRRLDASPDHLMRYNLRLKRLEGMEVQLEVALQLNQTLPAGLYDT